jgi:ketosteroid isomerase-like protein
MTDEQQSADEAAVRRVLEDITQAVRERDVDGLLAHCAGDIVNFDMVPPLEHNGVRAMRRLWAMTLGGFQVPLQYEMRDVYISVSGDVGFVRSLNRFGGTLVDSGKVDVSWIRSTLGLRKIEGTWKVVHEHVSVPFDMDTGRALLELQP